MQLQLLLSSLSIAAILASECPTVPWALNVFAMQNIGSPSSPYSSDFEGSAAAVGSAWYKGFSLNAVKPANVKVAHYVGGDLHMSGGLIGFGGVEAQGNVVLQEGATIGGDVQAGGDVSTKGTSPGRIQGSLKVQGAYQSATATGPVTQGSFQPTLNLQSLAQYYSSLSRSLAQLPSTLAATQEHGQLSIDASRVTGTEALTLSAASLQNLWGISINGPAQASVVINVPDSTVDIRSLTWSYSGGMPTGKAILNLPNAQSVSLQGGPHQVTLLAPLATVTYPQGLVVGTMVVSNLLGAGQVNFANVANAVRCVPTSAAPTSAAPARVITVTPAAFPRSAPTAAPPAAPVTPQAAPSGAPSLPTQKV